MSATCRIIKSFNEQFDFLQNLFAENLRNFLDSQSIRLSLVTELSLQVGQFILQNLHAHQDDVFRLQRSGRLDVEEELVWLRFPIVLGLVCEMKYLS